MKIKFKENLFVFLLVLYSSIGSSKAESASLDVSIDEITTTTLKISLAPADEGSSVQLWDVELDIQVLNYTYGNQIEFRDLFDGRLYELSVNGTGNRKWMSSITTAQCPEQWMGLRNNCYKRFNKKENRNAANLECSTSVLGAHLADPRRTEEFEFISSAEILTSTVALNWIGISLDGSNATYTDGSPVTEEIQAFKEEDDKASENCAVIQSNMNEYKWIEAQCEYETYFICEYTVPQCATNINISTSETSADIAWKTPKSLHGSDFGQYTIEIKEIKDFVTEKYIISRSSLNYTLPGLKSGHLYFFSIQASISTLHFESKSAKYTHAFLTNPNPPRHLRLINKSPTTITITWNKPESSHDNIFDKYCITYGETKIYVHKNFTTYTLEKLSPYTEYNIKVFSVSQISYLEKLSTAPADTSLTVLTDVSPVKDLRLIPESRHVTNFTITWSFAEGVVDSYEIQITENASDGQNPRIIEVENTANEFLISNLIPGQLYQVTVITKRLDGESDPVTLSERTRPPISHVHVQTKIGVDSVKIDIFESGSNHQKFYYSGYILSFTSSFQGKDEFIKKSESGITSSIITGLIPGTTYDFKAYTISGDVKSMPSDRGKISMELSPPEDFRVLTRNETSILVGWSSSRGEVSRYLVTCDECHDGAKLIGIDKANEAMFLKLSAGAEYVFTIVSQTSSNKEQRASKQVELVTRTKPKVPQNVAIDFVNQTSAVISWLPVDGTKSGYRVENVALENQYFTTRPANASWFRDKESVIVEQGKIIANLNDVTPGVAYHARVFSVSDDTSSEPASVFLTMLPNAVTHVKPSEVDEYWSTLRWKPGFGGYFEFLVEITLAGDEETVDTAYVTESNYNSTLPAPATLYYASISTLTLDRTWQSVPAGIFIQSRPLAVTDVEVYDVGEKSFTVRWNRPKSLYDNFRVVLSSDDIEDRKEFTEMSYVKFTDLIPGATYELKIFAIYNETSSHEVTATATLFPLAPTNLVSTGRTSTTISVKWNEAIGRADSYPIEWTPIDGEISIIDETATLSDLIPGVTYDIKVYAKSQNNIRRSEESAQVSIETKEALPGSPIFQSITTVDPTSVDIFWLKTPHPNGKILQHTIRYKQVYPHSHEEYEYKNFTATAESGRLESLDPGAWYVVHIRAQNSKGPGEWTNGEFIKNLPSLPGPVYNLTATAEKSRSLTITWETPEQPNGYIMQYELTVKDNMDNKIASVIFDRNLSGNPFECFEGQEPVPMNLFLQTLPTINDTLITGEKTFEANCPVSYMLEDLEAYSPYRIYVESFTSIGKGVSETTTGRTLEEAPSGPPQNIVVKNVGPTYLTLEWNPPDFPNGELTYSVSYFDRSGLVLRTTTNLSYYTMEDLRPYAVYAIHLIANTKAGSSEWTDFLLLNTTQDVPNKPVELSGKVMNSKSVYLSWYPPSGTRGIVTSYQVVIYDIDKQKSLRTDIVYSNARNITEQPSLSLNTGENENLPHPSVVPEVIAKIQELESKITIGVNETINYLVQHLNPYTLYEFRISAVTSAGPGNYSATQVKTAEDKPGSKPTNLRYENISSTSVNLTWAEPESPNGAIVAYEVIYISDEKELRFEVFDTTYAILKNMKKYSLYSVFVNSRTSAGRGPPSEELEMLTDEDVPGSPPFNLRYVNVTPTVAEVEWDPPLIPNGVIQFYTVYYKNETKEYSRKSNSTVIYLYDLRVYGEYWVQISASTRYGDGGLRSEPLYVHTGEGEPGSPPHELAYKNMTSSSVVLSWKKPLEPNGIIQHYVIRILPDSSEEYLRLQTEGADTEFVVENLKPDSSYTVLVHAHTKHGDGGVESDPLQIHTKEDAPGSPPKSLSYKNLSSTSVELSWNEPATPNGQIENYIIYYNDKILTVTASGSSVKINVDDLEPYTTYEFNVSASTKAGEGPTTSITVYTDEDSPTSAPRDVTYVQLSSTAITLSWKPPRKPNGIVTEYLVEYSIEDNVFDSVTYETNVTLSDLQKYATYLATVTAFTRVGQGPSSSPVIFQTLEDAPSDPPRNVTAISEESTSMFVSWEPPMQPNGIIQFYTVFIGDGENIRKNKVINATSTVVENLKIYTWYNIYVTASTALGDGGKKSDVIRSRTKEGAPSYPPRNVKGHAISSTAINVTWTEPLVLAGPTTYQIVVKLGEKTIKESDEYPSEISEVTVADLDKDTRYAVSVSAITSAGKLSSGNTMIRTDEDAPSDPPVLLRVNTTDGNTSTVLVEFLPPGDPNGAIYEYNLQYKSEKANHNMTIHILDADLPYTGEPVTNTSPHWMIVTGLLGGRNYYFRMNSATQEGTGPWSVWSSPILLPVNSPPVPNVTLVITSFGEENKAASSKLLVDICGVFSDENGPLENITVIVAEDEDKIDKDPTHWFEAYYMKPSPPYMVRATSNPVEFCSPDGQISKSTRKRRSIAEAPKFVLGNDQTCETTKKPYCNGPLKSNTPYRLKLRGTTTNGEYTETEFSDPVRTRSSFLEANMYLIVGLVVGIVVFVIFVIILVCVIRKRLTQQSLNESQRSDRSSGSLNKRATSSLPASPHNMSFVMEPTNVKGKKSITRPVSKAHFPNHVTRMSAHNDKGFASEFEEIESVTPFGPKTIGSQACNKSKNRFAEIIPYDHYRVKIENLGSTESSGYINASYIPGSSTPEQYIATQSPLGHTKNDLWRMIWETGAKRIIMLGNVDLEGNDHCTKYWPNTSQTTYYGNLSVQSLHEERQPEWTIRNFTISKREKRRQLTQYHFTMWPVRGVPDNPQPLVRFLQTFRMGKPVGDSPTVVMCSTGSGRTAVFIALDIIMDTIDKEINIDPCGVVADLRNYRPYMIQTAAEYSFLHRCLAYVLTSVSSEKSSVRSPTGDGEETTMF
ncbi:phosphatidylinositol phosphatase PTPRQ-like isoform X2 [Styela clava]